MFSKRTVCFVSGSSRGLGESIARNFACKLPERSAIVLLARNESDLEAVRKRLLEKSPNVSVIVHSLDQSSQDPEYFEAVFSRTFKVLGAKPTDFQQAIFVHNAATIQPVKYVRNLPPVQEVTQYMNANFCGVVALTTEFLKFFPAATSDFSRVVINVSSLAALQPFKSWAMYASGKAARNMFFKVLATEEEGVRVLNYGPGPLQTDMTNEIINSSEDKGMRDWMTSTKAEDKLLTCDMSVAKLTAILEKNTFESGAHIDYFDEI